MRKKRTDARGGRPIYYCCGLDCPGRSKPATPAEPHPAACIGRLHRDAMAVNAGLSDTDNAVDSGFFDMGGV